MSQSSPQSDAVECHVIVHGRVQGVFFRATTRDYAREMGLVGTVKNLPDGTVEMVVQGSRETIDQLLDKLASSSGLGHVDSYDTTYSPVKDSFPTFEVIY